MNYDELAKMSDDEVSEHFWTYHSDFDEDEAEYFRLMWRMCCGNFDRKLMIGYWLNKGVLHPDYDNEQKFMMDNCHSMVINYMANAPTWVGLFNQRLLSKYKKRSRCI